MKKSALETDTSEIITEPTVFHLDGKVVMIYGKYEGDLSAIRQACKSIKYQKSDRTSGLKTESRIFGFRPRRVMRGDFCSATSLSLDHPNEHKLICDFGVQFTQLYSLWAPEVYKHHEQLVSQEVREEWRIPKTVFTSGIINQNNSLKYHLDSGNFRDCMSCMLVLRKDIGGGMLSLPEFDLRLDLQDGHYLIFDGQKHLHGVTQIIRKTQFAYRYSIVFYALQQMCHCLPIHEEVQRIRTVKKAREEKRLQKERDDL